MAGLPLPPPPFLKSFAQIIADYTAAAQAESSTPLDFSEGSVFLALAEATGANVDWLQKLYVFALLVERLQTSQGQWVDTWTADFMPAVAGTNSPRLPAAPATGAVLFSRNVASASSGSLTTNTATTTGNDVLSFGSAVPSWVQLGMVVYDLTNINAIISGQIITNIVGSQITLSGNVDGAVQAGDTIGFSNIYAPPLVIPVGTLVATYDGSQVYQVYPDPTNPAYNANIGTAVPAQLNWTNATVPWQGGFVLPANQGSLNLNVQALTPGSAGNVNANTITTMQTSVVGIDTVTNPASIIVGVDQESDASLKARFKQFIQSLREGTPAALEYAVTSLQQGLQCTIHENVDPNGATDYGAVTMYVDDGSGNPPSTIVQEALAAVNLARAATVRPQVLGATKLAVNINMVLTTAAGYSHPAVVAAVANAVSTYVDNIGLENPLPYTMLAYIAYAASPGITDVTSLTINGATADITPAMGQTIKVGTLTVS
jgi:hypothetical protein